MTAGGTPGDAQPPRAILAASDKTGLLELAGELDALGWELVSTSGTARHLADAGLPVTPPESLTGMPEMFGGRVKTLHSTIFSGLLYRRGVPEDEADRERQGVPPIDLVACNFYPFASAAADGRTPLDELVSLIDVGGPAMVRAAAKNHDAVLVLVDPDDYETVVERLRAGDGRAGAVPLEERQRLAAKAFRYTAAYDELIAARLDGAATLRS